MQLRRGDLLLEKSGGGDRQSVGAVVLWDGDESAVCSNFIARLRCRSIVDPFYAALLHSTLYASGVPWRSIKQTTGIQNLDVRAYFDEPVFLPELDEQKLIVRYVDHAELRINRALQAKLQLLSLLDEKRRALVDTIVLRGLDPDARLVDSGVPWLGEVPAHWDIVPARALLRLSKKTVGKKSAEYQLLSLTLTGVIVRDLERLKGKFPASFDTYQVVEPGDFVLCLFDVDETPRAVGLSAHLGMITGAYSIYKCRDATSRDYLYQLLLSIDNGKKLKPIYRGLRKVVPAEAFASMRLLRPPAAERARIVSRLDVATSDLDKARAAIRGEVDLLREYRVRLIADVINGKKDVRGEAEHLPAVHVAERAAALSGGVQGVIDDDEGAEADADDGY